MRRPVLFKYALRSNNFKELWFAFYREKTLTVVSIPNSALASILHALDFPLPLILTFVREIDCFNKILAEKEF